MEEKIRDRGGVRLAASVLCVEIALSACGAGAGAAATHDVPAERGGWNTDAGTASLPNQPSTAAVGSTHGSDASADAALSRLSAAWLQRRGESHVHELVTPPARAADAGLTATLGSVSTSVAIVIAQSHDEGDASYAWYENVDDDAEEERCTAVYDDEDGERYVLCEGVTSACDGGETLEGYLLIEAAADDSVTVVIFASDLCDSGDDARACSYDAAGALVRCGAWLGAIIDPRAAP